MKKVVLLIMLCIATWSSFAQAPTARSSYLYTYSTGNTYSSIYGQSGTTTASSMNGGDDSYQTGIQIGFTFNYCGVNYTQLSACTNGWLSLANFAGANYPASTGAMGASGVGWLMIFWADDYGAQTVYRTTGTAPNRVFTFEWYNGGPCCSIYGWNYQVKLFESTNIIQYCFGAFSSNSSGRCIGIANSSTDYQTLATQTSTTSTTSFSTGCSHPASGTTYIWTPVCSGTPASGTATVTGPVVGCQGYTTLLTAAGVPGATGISTNWQSSLDGVTYSNIAGATNATYTPTVNATLYYRNNVTCSFSTNSAGTIPVLLTNNTPDPITGNLGVCNGTGSSLSSTTYGGVWSSTNSFVAAIDPVSGVVTTGMSPGTSDISYTTSGCSAVKTFTVNNNPMAFNVSAGSNYCSGSGGVDVNIAGSEAGVNYQLYRNSVLDTTLPGTTLMLDFYYKTTSGTYTVQGVNATTGCATPMTGSSVIVEDPIPGAITGINSVCINSTVTLNNSVAGGSWSSSTPFVVSADAVSGEIKGMSQGGAFITYTLPAGCYTTYPVSVLPAVQTITGAPGVCQGLSTTLNDGTPMGLWSSGDPAVATASPSTGVINGLTAGTAILTYATSPGCREVTTFTVYALPLPITGPSSAPLAVCLGNTLALADGTPGGSWGSNDPQFATIDFVGGMVTAVAPGVTTITYTTTDGCLATAPLTVNDLPGQYQVTVSGGGSYCPGGAGASIQAAFSNAGIDYSLYRGAILVNTQSGANSSLDFGLQPTVGTYKVVATNPFTQCSVDMSNTVSVSLSPLPANKSVTINDNGHYCAGGAGNTITVMSPDYGVNYQLYKNNIPLEVLTPVSTGDLSYVPKRDSGLYYVIATDATTTCSLALTNRVNVRVDPLPTAFNVNGGGAYCVGNSGVNVGLDNSSGSVTYYLYHQGSQIGSATGTGGGFSFGAQTAAGDYTVLAESNLPTHCQNSMAGKATIVISQLPSQYPVSADGNGHYCANTAGSHITLDFSALGVDYQLYRGSTAIGASLSGLSSQLDFGTQSVSGVYKVVGTNSTTQCVSDMSNPINIVIDAVPTAYPVTVTGGGSFCAGDPGQHIMLNGGSSLGVNYDLYNNGALELSLAGTGTTLDFGLFNIAGTYTVVATDNVLNTHCANNMLGSAIISINPLPDAYPVTGSNSFCSNMTSVVPVMVSGSRVGVSYQLYNGLTPVGLPKSGTGSSLNFGAQSASGNYTVLATNIATLCKNSMNGTAKVDINPVPNKYYMTGGGTYCTGGSGINIGLNNSDLGVKYQVYVAGAPVGLPVAGAGGVLDFGLETVVGTYSVKAVDDASGCSNIMLDTKNVTTIPPPSVFTITGGGRFCSGDRGTDMRMSGSSVGVKYQVYRDGNAVGTPVLGTGLGIDFGYQTVAGSYKVVAINGSTACTRDMAGTPTIVVDDAPAAYSVTGGGISCLAGNTITVDLGGSNLGNNYQLYNGSTPVGLPIGGTEYALHFDSLLASGNYRVKAVNTSNGCTTWMQDSASVTLIPSVVPAVNVTSFRGVTQCVGLVDTFKATAVNGGTAPSFTWSVNGATVTGGSTFFYVPANGDIVEATVTSNATCVTTPNATNSITKNVIIYELPTSNVTVSPSNNICKGTSVTFTATETNQGSTPVHSWLKNGVIVGSGMSYTYTPNDNDVVFFMLNSSIMCRSADTVFSNYVYMNVDSRDSLSVNVVNVTADGDTSIVGYVDSLEARVTRLSGTSPLTYQWYVNGSPIPGAINKYYVHKTVFNNDELSCVVTGSNACGAQFGKGSIQVIHLVNTAVNNILSSSDIRVMPNPNKGTFFVKGSFSVTDELPVTVELTNMLGQVVYKTNMTVRNGQMNEQISLNGSIASGMYLLNVKTGTESKVFHVAIEQ